MKKLIIDTDIGSDCDDAGALAIAHRLADRGEAEIMAVTHCGSEISGAVTIRAINEYYRRAEIPVGRYTAGVFLEEAHCRRFTAQIMEDYLKTHERSAVEEAVKVQRKVLAGSGEQEVTLIAIGMLNNYAALLRSEPDEISEQSGMDLVKKHVKELYVMGGNFADRSDAEYNIRMELDSARYVASYFPAPVIYAGFELGASVLTGNHLKQSEEQNPVKQCYDLRQRGVLRESWDPITVYCAIRDKNPYYRRSERTRIAFDEQGRVLLSGTGKDCYLIAEASEEAICAELECYMY